MNDQSDDALGKGVPIGSGYTLDALIGQGAMGQVWRGATREGEPVAVKVLRSDLTSDPAFVARFLQEAQLLTHISHENLVTVRDLVAERSRLAIVMDLVDGPDLRAELTRVGTYTPYAAGALIHQLLDGLHVVHSAGVVHRDIKPENVLLAGEPGAPVARLADFGIARLVEQGPASRTTAIVGTPEYMAPELADGEAPTPQSDLYSLGILLYELLTGVTPFVGGPPLVVLRRHVTAIPGRPQGVPDQLWGVISELLAKDPKDRPASAAAARDRLAQVGGSLNGLPAGPKLTAPPPPVDDSKETVLSARKMAAEKASPETQPKRALPDLSRNTWIAAAAAAALVIGGGVWAMNRSGSSAEAGHVTSRPPTVSTSPTTTTSSTTTTTTSRPPGVPPVVGLTLASATEEITNAGMRVEVKEQIEDSGEDLIVLEQSPKEGTATPGTKVMVTVRRSVTSSYLANMEPVEGKAETGLVTISGKGYTQGISHRVSNYDYGGGDPWQETWQYDLGRNYRQFTADIGMTDTSRSALRVRLDILVDGKPIQSVDTSLGKVTPVTVDVTGVLRLAFVVKVLSGTTSQGGYSNIGLGDPKLYSIPSSPITDASAQ